ncbi:MAG: hypothetical protein JWO86_4062 [Myxococcaceae bacterium]|nr:hypothetical protein [Myxococcaceae bacterium]
MLHRSHVPLYGVGAALALCLATASCAAPSNNEQAASIAASAAVVPEIEEIEETLALSVVALDVRHGTLRIEASMDDGSADVSMWLGDAQGCGDREVGHGIATRSGFAWSLSRDEVARAIECSLTVKVHAINDEGQHVRRVAQLPVSVAVQPDGADLVRLRAMESEGSTTTLTFMGPSEASRLHVAGTIIGASDPVEINGKMPRGAFLSSFVVDNDDLARSMFARSHLTILGEEFLAAVTVGNFTLDVSRPEPPTEPEPVQSESESGSPPPQQYYYDDGCDDCGDG